MTVNNVNIGQREVIRLVLSASPSTSSKPSPIKTN